MRRGHMKGADASIGLAGDVKLVIGDLVVSQNPGKEFRENALPAFEEQAAIGRRGNDDNVASPLRLSSPVALDRAVDDVHGLRSAAECKYPRIGLGRVVGAWKHNLVVNRDAGDVLA